MITFPDNTLNRLEFEEVLRQIAAMCGGAASREEALAIRPSAEFNEVNTALNRAHEFHVIRLNALAFPEFHYLEVQKELSTLKIAGAVLEGRQFLLLAELALMVSGLIRGVRKLEESDALQEMVQHIEPDESVVHMVGQILNEHGRVKSSASRVLASIRKQIDELRKKANKHFETLVRRYRKLGWLREYTESVYHDRRVLAVVAEYKHKLEGIIHGSSESGNTAFVEPSELVGVNNELAGALHREKEEERRILKQLTREVAHHRPTLLRFFELLTHFDLLEAKARWFRANDCVRPKLNRDCSRLRLISAVHPVLQQKNKSLKLHTIPLDLELDPEQSMLVISGPNAGGKSVSLKTTGLLQLMTQSGLLIPADEISELPVFAQLLVDIGDDQSIEQQLSTYSSRLKKLKHFLRVADARTLILLDEFGTGSDPELGGAIAESILIHLMEFKPWGIITTHFGNIKVAAQQISGLRNASMLFNEETLEPTYRLKLDTPGSSYTFEVAQKIGLDRKVLNLARKKIDKGRVRLDKLLVDMQENFRQLEHERSAVQAERDILRKELERLEEEWESIRNFKASRQKEEFARLVEAGRKYEDLLEKWKRGATRKELLEQIVQAGQKRKQKEVRAAARSEGGGKKPRRRKTEKKPIEVGDRVKLPGGKSTGTVASIADGKAMVEFGNMRLQVKTDTLVLAMKKK